MSCQQAAVDLGGLTGSRSQIQPGIKRERYQGSTVMLGSRELIAETFQFDKLAKDQIRSLSYAKLIC